MKRDLGAVDCLANFADENDMLNFLEEMDASDEWLIGNISSVLTNWENDEGHLKVRVDDELKDYPLSPLAIPALERRSGDDASGHELMTIEQILNSMNNYWKLHDEKEEGKFLLRGGMILSAGSRQYEPIPQMDLASNFANHCNVNGGKFHSGFYTHEGTSIIYEAKNVKGTRFGSAWIKMGLSPNLLDEATILYQLHTDDVSGSAARVNAVLKVGGSTFQLGEVITVKHRVGSGSLNEFLSALAQLDDDISEDLGKMRVLMNTPIKNPTNTLISAIKKAGLHKISKKACKEIVENAFFAREETAFTIYISLSEVTNTEIGSKLSEDRKLRLQSAIRTLLNANWSKLDVAGDVEL
jgi:hypothetical protein